MLMLYLYTNNRTFVKFPKGIFGGVKLWQITENLPKFSPAKVLRYMVYTFHVLQTAVLTNHIYSSWSSALLPTSKMYYFSEGSVSISTCNNHNCDHICQKGSYTRTVSGLTFHYHSTDTTIDQQFMLVPLPNLQRSVLLRPHSQACLASMDAWVVCKWLQLPWSGKQPAGNHHRTGW